MKKFALADIVSTGNGLPNRVIIHAVEGWGKTSFAAQMKNPVYIETKGETGLETLIDAGQLPRLPHFPEVQSWEELIAAIEFLRDEEHQFRTLVGDTLNGAERLCHEFICHRDYNDDWTKTGFASYNQGFDVSLSEWRRFLALLDELRSKKKMAIVWLCHTKIRPFRNPEGADYDRYQPDCHEKTWGLTHKWADVVLFGNFEAAIRVTEKNNDGTARKGKASGGQRVMYTTRSAAFDAKNRLGLQPDIDMGSSPAEAFANFISAVKAGKPEVVNAQ